MHIRQHLFEFLRLIPEGKVITYGYLGKIFATSPVMIGRLLSQNTNQDRFPCYKVVNSDGTLGGYNLGIEEKIKRLEKDGIKLEDERVTEDYFRFPKPFHYFLAIPLEYEERRKFKELVFDIKDTFPESNIRFQKLSSPHLTIRFLGDIEMDEFGEYLQKTLKIIHKYKDVSKSKFVFDELGNFDERVFYFSPKDENTQKTLQDIYDTFHEGIGMEKEDRPFAPHLTIFKAMEFSNGVENVLEHIKDKSLEMTFDKLTFFCAVDKYFQLPIIDILI